ncbi:MAG: hypothetical protein OXN86_04970 [Chloroflexota bacterium]|nr:hypothetical protein [Chloroflexota bacterium]
MTTHPDHEASHERLEADLAALGQQVALILDGINNLSDRIHVRFSTLDERLNGIDRRLDRHNERFDQLDQRLNGIDRRLDRHDQRFDRLDQRTEDIARHLGVPKRNGLG